MAKIDPIEIVLTQEVREFMERLKQDPALRIWEEVLSERDEARRQLAEAAECVRLLMAIVVALVHAPYEDYWPAKEVNALPAWLRKRIEE